MSLHTATLIWITKLACIIEAESESWVVIAKKVLTRLTYSWQDGKKICKVYMHIKDSKNQCTIPFKDQYKHNTLRPYCS